MAQHIRTGFFLSHSHKAQVRLFRAGSHLLLKKTLQTVFLSTRASFTWPSRSHSHSVQHQPTQRSPKRLEQTGFLLRKKGKRRKRHPPSNTVYVERPPFDDIAFGTEGKDTVIGGTVQPPRELGRVGELQVFPGEKKLNKTNKMIQSTAYIVTAN